MGRSPEPAPEPGRLVPLLEWEKEGRQRALTSRGQQLSDSDTLMESDKRPCTNPVRGIGEVTRPADERKMTREKRAHDGDDEAGEGGATKAARARPGQKERSTRTRFASGRDGGVR